MRKIIKTRSHSGAQQWSLKLIAAHVNMLQAITYTNRDRTERVAVGCLGGLAELFETGLAVTTVDVVMTNRSELKRCRTLAKGKAQRAKINGYS